MPFLTVRQAAERLGVGYSTLKQWIYKGSVRTTRTEGGHHRIAETEVERLLAKEGRAPAARAPRRAGGGVLMVVSGRNRLRGIVDEVRRDGLIATQARSRGHGADQSDRGDDCPGGSKEAGEVLRPPVPGGSTQKRTIPSHSTKGRSIAAGEALRLPPVSSVITV